MNRAHVQNVILTLATTLAVFAVSVSFTHAQNSEDALRASIRANIMSDSRAANLSSVQIDAMVDALAGEAETQGTAAEYLESQQSSDHFAEFVAYNDKLPKNTPLPLYIAVGTLVAVLALGGYLIVRHRHAMKIDFETTPVA